jgi:spore maturation protein CgeB
MGRLQKPRPDKPAISRAGPAAIAAPICVTSTVPDALNSNARIRHYVAEGFRGLLPGSRVISPGFHAAAAEIETARPGLVVAVGGLAIDAVDLTRLRRAADRARAPLALWLHDDPYEFDYAFKARGLADVIFTNDSWCVPHYGPGPVFHLPLAASPSVHFRDILPAEGRDIDLFFCGVGYPNRVRLLRQAAGVLRGHACVVKGDHWPDDLGFAANQRLSPADFCDHAQRALLTLNLARDHNVANRRLGLPAATPGPRTFEVALAGSAQIAFTESLELLDHFAAGSEILLADHVTDLREAILRGLDEPAWLVDIARRAQRRALADHTYAHRARTMLDCLRAAGCAPASAPALTLARVRTALPTLPAGRHAGQRRAGGTALAIR